MHFLQEHDLGLNVSQIDNSETPNNNSHDDILVLKNICVNYPYIIITHLNINPIPNKYEILSLSVAQYVAISMLSETKSDSTFLSTQFLINGFSVSYGLDQNNKGGGILLHMKGGPHIDFCTLCVIMTFAGGGGWGYC